MSIPDARPANDRTPPEPAPPPPAPEHPSAVYRHADHTAACRSAVVRSAAERHGIDWTCERAPGLGAPTLTVALPGWPPQVYVAPGESEAVAAMTPR